MREALQEIKELVCGERNPNWIDSVSISRNRARIADIVDSALDEAAKPVTREEFEAWASESPRFLNLLRNPDGTYAFTTTFIAWEAVQWATGEKK